MSINSSTPKITATPIAPNPPGMKLLRVANRITRAARGTPATPFEVIINVSIMKSWRPKLMWPIVGSAACATKIEAIAR